MLPATLTRDRHYRRHVVGQNLVGASPEGLDHLIGASDEVLLGLGLGIDEHVLPGEPHGGAVDVEAYLLAGHGMDDEVLLPVHLDLMARLRLEPGMRPEVSATEHAYGFLIALFYPFRQWIDRFPITESGV